MDAVKAHDTAEGPDMTKVSVAIRVRPLIDREQRSGDPVHWQVGPQELMQYDIETKRTVSSAQPYVYDHVFNHSTQTTEVYDRVVSPIVKKSFTGFNGTILCYGQTSSGKTHTLYGSSTDKGIILLFADHLFAQVKADEGRRQYIIKVGLIEIYNEKVTDLLNSENPIELQEREGRVVPNGLEEITVFKVDDIQKVAERIQRERKIGETRMNKESSRSHTILRVTIESFDLMATSRYTDASVEQSPPLTTAVLNFVDLAGSEKQSQTGAEGERFKEMININKSLSVLSHVIQQLSDSSSTSATDTSESSITKAICNSLVRPAPKSRFINFRDSKLTRLLQSTLNGEAYITMICNITIASLEETKSTLLFARQAKKINVRPKQNLCSSQHEYEKKLKELQELLNRKDKEMEALHRQCENLKRVFELRSTSAQLPNVDRRLSLCPSMLQRFTSDAKKRCSENALISRTGIFTSMENFSSNSFSTPNKEVFMSAKETGNFFRQLTTVREASHSEVSHSDKEVQTDLVESASSEKRIADSSKDNTQTCLTPRKKPRSSPDTPSQTLRLSNAILRATNESDHNEWIEQRAYLEAENQALREDVSKIPQLEKEISRLNEEKILLEEDVGRQMQASKLELKRRTTEFETALAPMSTMIEALQEKLKDREKRHECTICVNSANEVKNSEFNESNLLEKQSRNAKFEAEMKTVAENFKISVELEHEKTKFQTKIASLSLTVANLKEELLKQENITKELSNKEIALKTDKAEIQAKLLDKEGSLKNAEEELRAVCSTFDHERTKLESKITALSSTVVNLKEELLKQEKEFIDKEIALKAENDQNQSNLMDAEILLTEELKLVNETFDVEKEKFESKIASLSATVAKLKEELLKQENITEELSNKEITLKTDKAEIQAKLLDKEGSLKKAEEELRTVCSTFDHERTKLESKITVLSSTVVNLKEELLKQANEFIDKVIALKAENDHNQSNLMEAEILLTEELKLVNETFEVEKEKFESKIASLSATVAKLKEELLKQEKEFIDKEIALKAENDKNQSNLMEAEILLTEELKLVHETFEVEKEKFESKITALSSTVVNLKEEQLKQDKEFIDKIALKADNDQNQSNLMDAEILLTDELKLVNETFEVEKKKFESKIASLSATVAKLKEELLKQENITEELSNKEIALKADKAEIQAKLLDKEGSLKNAEEELRAVCSTFDHDRTKLESKITALSSTVVNLKEELLKQEKEFIDKEIALKAENKQNQSNLMEAEILLTEDLKLFNETFEVEKEKFESKITALSSTVDKLKEELLKQENITEELSNKEIALKTDKAEIQAKLLDKEGSLKNAEEELRAVCSTFDHERTTYESKITALSSTVVNLKEELLKQEKEFIDREIALKAENDQNQSNLMEAEILLTEELKLVNETFEVEKEKFESKIASLSATVAKLKEELLKQENITEELSNKEIALKTDKAEIQAKLLDKEGSLKNAEEELRAVCSTFDHERTKYESKITALSSTVVNLKEELLKQEKEFIDREIALKAENDQNQSNLMEAEILLTDELKLVNETFEVEKEKFESKIASLSATVAKLKEELLKQENITKELSNKEIALKTDKAEIQAKLLDKEGSLKKAEEKLRTVCSTFDHERTRFESKITALSSTVVNLKEELLKQEKEFIDKEIALKAENDQNQSNLMEAEILLTEELKLVNETFEVEKEKFESKIASLSATVAKLKEELEKREHSETELTQMEVALKAEKEEIEFKLNRSETRIRELENSIIKWEGMISSAEVKLREQKSAYESEISNLAAAKDSAILELQEKIKEKKKGSVVMVNRSTQGDSYTSLLETIKHYRVREDRLKYELNKIRTANEDIMKHQDAKLSKAQSDVTHRDDIIKDLENKLTMVNREQVTISVQCDLLEELVERSQQGERGLLPDFFPDVAPLRRELKRAEVRIDLLQIQLQKNASTMSKLLSSGNDPQDKPIQDVVSKYRRPAGPHFKYPSHLMPQTSPSDMLFNPNKRAQAQFNEANKRQEAIVIKKEPVLVAFTKQEPEPVEELKIHSKDDHLPDNEIRARVAESVKSQTTLGENNTNMPVSNVKKMVDLIEAPTRNSPQTSVCSKPGISNQAKKAFSFEEKKENVPARSVRRDDSKTLGTQSIKTEEDDMSLEDYFKAHPEHAWMGELSKNLKNKKANNK